MTETQKVQSAFKEIVSYYKYIKEYENAWELWFSKELGLKIALAYGYKKDRYILYITEENHILYNQNFLLDDEHIKYILKNKKLNSAKII